MIDTLESRADSLGSRVEELEGTLESSREEACQGHCPIPTVLESQRQVVEV